MGEHDEDGVVIPTTIIVYDEEEDRYYLKNWAPPKRNTVNDYVARIKAGID
jgi:hypothetical protein